MNEESIKSWAEQEYRTNQDVIEDLGAQQVKNLIKEEQYVLIFACKLEIFTPRVQNYHFKPN